ncbi:MAG: proton-conducting transporter membrane subunit [Candidatus Limnocylindria bacterium]
MPAAAIPTVLLALAAAVAFALRKRVRDVAVLSLLALAAAMVVIALLPDDARGEVFALPLRLSPLARLASLVSLGTLLLLVVDVWLGEPAYNFFPTSLGIGAALTAVLLLVTPLALYAALLAALLLPIGSFVFQVQRNRSVEAALRHFGFVALGGCLGLSALALAARLPHDEPANTFVLLVVILIVAFALKLAAIPFHTHASLLAAEAPTAALALYFGVLVPATFIAFVEILTLSGLLPAIVQVAKVPELLLGLGLVSALGGSLLATGAGDLRRLVVCSVISNVGVALVGLSTLSGPGIVGGIAVVLVTGVCATQQLIAAGALERRAAGGQPAADRAPLAAAAFVAGGVGIIGAPPLLGFPGHFFVELIAYSYASWLGAALVLATLALLLAQVRAGIALFSSAAGRGWTIERRPVAGLVGLAIFAMLLAGGVMPEPFLRPISAFADEFLRALRPL